MIYWIFDMDETLYNSGSQKFSYGNLAKDTELISLINKLNGRKILFTNASHMHTNVVLDRLGLVSSFDLILDRDTVGILKPHPNAFLKLIKWCSINKNDTCYFFEDTINNLIIGNTLGWQSIYINPSQPVSMNNVLDVYVLDSYNNKVKKKTNINYTFNDIKSALKHFINRLDK
jgi:FMN phosphatase YigB (HAD superfamily)